MNNSTENIIDKFKMAIAKERTPIRIKVLFTVTFFALLAIGIYAILNENARKVFFDYLDPDFFRVTLFGLFGYAVLRSLSQYLLGYLSPREKEISKSGDQEVADRIQAIAENAARKAAEEVRTSLIDREKYEEIVTEIKSDLHKRANDDAAKELLDNIRADLEKTKNANTIGFELFKSSGRLENAIEDLNQRANLNLVVGIIITVVGVVILLILILTAPSENTWLDFAKVYLPRLTLAILVELFAYFFLKLYKANLSETRYFHNEITNIAARLDARNTGLAYPDKSYLEKTVVDLLKMERNGTLTKSQTTVELAKAKLEADSSKDLASVLSKIAEALAKAKPHPDHTTS